MVSSGIYLNGADRVLLRSINGGTTWQIRNNTEGGGDGSALFAFGEDIWFLGQNSMYHFDDSSTVNRIDSFSRNSPDLQSYPMGFRKDSLYLITSNANTVARSTPGRRAPRLELSALHVGRR